MLSKLTINNFQAHKVLELDLDQITTIVGRSDAGKSSILRSLKWICFNRPSGDYFKHKGTDFVRVKLVIDGKTIIRHKGKKGNYYKLNGKTYKALGQNVPEAIVQLLNVGEANFQNQFDAHFWFSESPGQVSKQLNEIVNLGLIDSTLDYIAKQMRRAKTTVEISKERLDNAKSTLSSLEFVPELETNYKILLQRESKIQVLQEGIASLCEQIEQVQELEHVKENADRICKYGESEIKRLGLLLAGIEESGESYNSLYETFLRVKRLKQQSKELGEQAEAKGIELHKQMKGVCPICQKPI